MNALLSTNQRGVSYALVLIKVDASKPLPEAILVEDEEGHVHNEGICMMRVARFLRPDKLRRH